ncbi:hypothetical protein CS542_09185 [Pedobacter sp. IW39]|nr:hypothetical protein CS542_09185 [Pedobacter sp. IW39]
MLISIRIFRKIVEAVVKERDLSRNPLFQVCFTLLNIRDGDLKLQDVELSAEPMEQTKYNLISRTPGSRTVCPGQLNTVQIFIGKRRFHVWLAILSCYYELLANPVTRICDLEMLSTRRAMLLSFETAVDHELEPGTTLLDAFAIQVEYAPDAIAVVRRAFLSYKIR